LIEKKKRIAFGRRFVLCYVCTETVADGAAEHTSVVSLFLMTFTKKQPIADLARMNLAPCGGIPQMNTHTKVAKHGLFSKDQGEYKVESYKLSSLAERNV
jgi:hypothetical protein